MLTATTTYALVGADGAGKSTIGRLLAADPALNLAYVYMGVNLEASNVMLPTTRLYLELRRRRGQRPDMAGPRDTQVEQAQANRRRSFNGHLRAGLRLINQVAEEWYRQIVVLLHRCRGRSVVFDRHFFVDYYFHDVDPPDGAPWDRRLHGAMLRKWYPKPDHVICLDVPPEALWDRKPETPVPALRRRRDEYLAMAGVVDDFRIVDATASVVETYDALVAVITATRPPRVAQGLGQLRHR